jgi:hypothetical protein
VGGEGSGKVVWKVEGKCLGGRGREEGEDARGWLSWGLASGRLVRKAYVCAGAGQERVSAMRLVTRVLSRHSSTSIFNQHPAVPSNLPPKT